MGVEIDKRVSRAWTVFYQPGIPSRKIEKYQEMFHYLDTIVLDSSRFDELRRRNRACYEATTAFAKPTDAFLKEFFNLRANDDAKILFSEKVAVPGYTPQLGQNVLRIFDEKDDTHSIIVDIACYLLGISFGNMPIVVGSHGFIEGAMSEIYSIAIGKNIAAKLVLKNIFSK